MAAGWRSIATAPKDGRPILSWDGDTYAVIVWCGCRRDWFLVEISGNRPYSESPPWEHVTHWRALPPAPGSAP